MLEMINRTKKIYLYGLSTETERVLAEWNGKYNVIGLLDGFKTSGDQFGYPILDINDVVKMDNVVIIVVARPGSCKAITKRIGNLCKENNIKLYDVRGKDLLTEEKVVYDFRNVLGYTKEDLLKKIESAEVVSFDLFDTLVMRDVLSSSDVIKLVNARLIENGIVINDFVEKRIACEKQLSQGHAPRLEHIYLKLITEECLSNISALDLANLEYKTDVELLHPREEMVSILNSIKRNNKTVYITSESYYSSNQISDILTKIGVLKVDGLIVSCEFDTGKTGNLFECLLSKAGSRNILHVGDDIVADVESANRHEIQSFQIYSASELLDSVGGLNLLKDEMCLSDRIRVGMFIANLFNSPFQFEDDTKRIHAEDAKDIGYLFCAPMVMDFTRWFEEETNKFGNTNRWLCARDGYLLKKLYEIMYPSQNAEYFYTSRISAIRAGVEDIADIEFVDGMKFSGVCEENLKTRFGIVADTLGENDINENEEGLLKYSKVILDYSKSKRINNLKYINKLNVQKGGISFFDFVAKGTSQVFIQKLVKNPMKGLYFLQLEPEFMKDKNLDIKPFYTEMERDSSAIFDNYYILETILTAPEPSVDEFDNEGNPVFAKETRSDKDIRCFMRAQDGIVEYVKKYTSICPESERDINKKLDEAMLTLVHNVEIRDQDFLSLTVEDPFFNRMTDITDVI